MTGKTFAEHLAGAQQRPEYWSYGAAVDFLDLIVDEMRARGVSSAELARRMGTSRAYVSKVLAGERNFTVATMGKLAFALGMRLTVGLERLEAEERADMTPADEVRTAKSRSA
jgi:transcriptional regulator with XRE-family HTH domain